jgi:predicted RNA binding protein YcfA (HicA-like mRNA interferase family)
VSGWPSTKARIVYKALLKNGWIFLRQVGSHKKLTHPNYGNYTWAFHDNEEIGPVTASPHRQEDGIEAERFVKP